MTVSSARPQKTPDPADVYAGQVLRALRKKQGLSQEKLADALGVTFQQLQKYERAANRISVSKLDKIARILDVSPALFFERDEAPDRAVLAMSNDEHKILALFAALPTARREDFLALAAQMVKVLGGKNPPSRI